MGNEQTWSPALASQQPLFMHRVGLLRGEARIYFHTADDKTPRYVLKLTGVFKMYDGIARGQAVEISEQYPHGSFGWNIPHDEPHYSIQISATGHGMLLVLARNVEYRMAERDEALNWPA